MKTKKIEEIRLKLSEIRTDFGNPRRIERAELDKLKRSIMECGDFGVIVVNEQNQTLSGNQRIAAMKELGVEEVLCKRLVGYSEEEQKRVLLEANATRGKYEIKRLEEFLEGTALNLDDYNISTMLAKSEEVKQQALSEEIKIIPLVVAINEDEYDEFMRIKEELGVKTNLSVIKKIIKQKKENDD